MTNMNLKDIARELNVSKTTVSLVLNDRGDELKISKDTQKRIISYVREKNYVPNQLARGLSRGKSETIGLIIPNISDTFYALIAGYVENKAMKLGYNVIFSSSYEDTERESYLINGMLNRQVDGLIIASSQKNGADMKRLCSSKFPFVLIDRHYPDLNTDYVIVDNFGGTYHATKHLIKKGRKKIGFVTIASDLEAMKQRLEGYRNAMVDFSDAQEIVLITLSHKNYADEMHEVLKSKLSPDLGIDGLLFATHYLAREGIRTLKKMGKRIPEDIAVISFSDISGFDLVSPPITIVTQPIQQIGETAVEILLIAIEEAATNKKVKRKIVEQVILNTGLEIRQSCG